MTIVKPKKKNNHILFFTFLAVLVIMGGAFYISAYNSVASKRFEIEKTKDEIVKVEIENIEIKNELYQDLNPTNLKELAKNYSLVMDTSPNYLNINQWISDSSY